VVRAEDGHPDNPAGHGADFHPAEPIRIDNVGGNLIVLDLGDGQYAHYFHLKTGSVRLRVGDHVRKGEVIGAIGASGDAREPHVHLEIIDARGTLAGEGLPYVIDHYSVMDPKTGVRSPRTRQLPLDGMIIDFGT
jgi:murein DD-endopeptidase MepM/ murein hydrolase activator NlpD